MRREAHSHQSSPRECNTNLAELLTTDSIRVGCAATNPEDAIREAGDLLVSLGYATPGYTEAMLDLVRRLGPYIVLAPGIALAHARPECGALHTGIVLVTLSAPVNFNHPTNDPVSIVFALAAEDSNGHIELLSTLARFLDDDSNVKLLREAKNSVEISSSVRVWMGEIEGHAPKGDQEMTTLPAASEAASSVCDE